MCTLFNTAWLKRQPNYSLFPDFWAHKQLWFNTRGLLCGLKGQDFVSGTVIQLIVQKKHTKKKSISIFSPQPPAKTLQTNRCFVGPSTFFRRRQKQDDKRCNEVAIFWTWHTIRPLLCKEVQVCLINTYWIMQLKALQWPGPPLSAPHCQDSVAKIVNRNQMSVRSLTILLLLHAGILFTTRNIVWKADVWQN